MHKALAYKPERFVSKKSIEKIAATLVRTRSAVRDPQRTTPARPARLARTCRAQRAREQHACVPPHAERMPGPGCRLHDRDCSRRVHARNLSRSRARPLSLWWWPRCTTLRTQPAESELHSSSRVCLLIVRDFACIFR